MFQEFQAQNLIRLRPLGLKHVNLKKATAAKLNAKAQKQKKQHQPIAQKIPAKF